jgi:hypothetical protein
MPDENFLFQSNSFANESVAGDLAAIPHSRPLLNFNESANLYLVADFATIQIGEPENLNPSPQLNVSGNALERMTHVMPLPFRAARK